MSKLYLGKRLSGGKLIDIKQEMSAFDLTTHVFVCGSTGSGKTVLGKILIEESLKNRIPAVLIDLKGDLSSFAIPVREINYFTFEKWIEARSGESKNEILKKVLYQYQKNFEEFEMSEEELRKFRDSIEINIYTPKSSITQTLSLSPLTSPPDNVQKLMEYQSEQVLNLINTNVKSLLAKAFSGKSLEDLRIEIVFLEELVKYFWLKGENLVGESGLKKLIQQIIDPEIVEFEGLTLENFISKERRMELARALNTLLLGANRLWFKGTGIKKILEEIEYKVKTSDKVPLVIFNLSFLDSFEEKNFVLSNIAYEISVWMRREVSSGAPKLLFYLDEIGGGNTSFYPAEPYTNSSKEALNILLRQGRAFGICCILSTQNPGDIDYTGLTNCHTWFIGKLQTQEDRDKILQGIANFHIASGNLENFLKTAKTGEFAVKDKSGDIFEFKQRWLYSFHKVMGERDFQILSEILKVEKLLKKVEGMIEEGLYSRAKQILYKSLEQDVYENTYLLFEIAKIEFKEGNKEKALELLNRIVAIQIGDYSIWRMKAELEIEQEKWEEAQHSLERLLQFMPFDEWGIEKLGYVYYKLGKYEKSEQMLEKILKLQENNSELYFLMAQVKKGQGDYLKAVEYINKAIDLDLENARFYYLKGTIFKELDEMEIAVDAFLRALELDENCYHARLELAEIYLENQMFEKALEFVKKAISTNPQEIDSYLLLSRIYHQMGKLEEGIAILEKMVEKGISNDRIYFVLSQLLEEKNDLAGAIKYLTLAIKQNDKEEYLLLMANILLSLDKKQEALAVLDKLIAKSPDFKEAYQLKAKIYLSLKEEGNFQKTLDEILKLDPQDDWALLEKAKFKEKEEKWDEALSYYKKIKSKDLVVWERIAELNEKLGNYLEAISAYDHLTDSVSDNPDFWLKKAQIFYQMEKFDNALDACDKVKMIDENNIQMWNLMMNIFNRQGEYSKAKFCQDKIEQLGGEVQYEF